MSTDTMALFDNKGEKVTAGELFLSLSTNPQFATDLIEHYQKYWQPQEWTLVDSSTQGPGIVGPGGFTIRQNGTIIRLFHIMSFGIFAGDRWSRNQLQQACRDVAAFVGSEQVIYTHDLMPYEGANLNEISHWLQKHIGPPAVNFAELYDADSYGPRAWYVDTL
jgi:hypothetical protein